MMKLLRGIYQIFRWVREFTVTVVFLLFALAFFAFISLWSSAENKTRPVDFTQGALRLDLAGYLADNHDEFGDLRRILKSEVGGYESEKISVFDVVRVIKKAQKDPKITGIVLELSKFEGGDLPSLRFIAKALNGFKAEKPLIAVGESYSQSQYYLAMVADEIWLNQAGSVDLQGMSYSNLYYKSLFDKIEATPHIFRVGTYKSAVEPFMRNDMSPEAKANAERWLGLMWEGYTKAVSVSRQIDQKNVLPVFDDYLTAYKNAKGSEAEYALNAKLVTHIGTAAEMRRMLQNKFGKDEEGRYNHIGYFDYAATLSDRFDVPAADKIAVVNVEGAIVSGVSDEQNAGSNSIVKQINRARNDKSVRGLILRVNSPGGSAVASELIRQEVEAAQQGGLPVVVSMGGMAASGGYWISATADKIIASPDTLTGSIGIFGLAVTFEKTAKNLGVSQDGIATSPLAEFSSFKTLTSEQSRFLQTSVDFGYQRFLKLVAKGRKMPVDSVDKVAQGQVWLGFDAHKKGLVDQLGDFDDAYLALSRLINERRQAKNQPTIERFATQWFIDEDSSLFGAFMRDFKLNVKTYVAQWLGLPNRVKETVSPLAQFNDPKQLYLLCESCGRVK